MRSVVPASVVLLLLLVPAFPQITSDSVFQAHGGAALLAKGQACEVRGTLEQEAGVKTPFVLKLSGRNSRFETDQWVAVKNGMTEQSWRNGEPRGDIMSAVLGNVETYFLPFLALSDLKKGDFQAVGLKDGYYTFSARLPWQRFLAYQPDTPILELAFNPETRLLAELRFFTLEGNQTPVTVVCSDYFFSDGIAVPRRVEQIVGGLRHQGLVIDSVVFGASFAQDDFSITR